ncbi:MAG TPA: glycosyltransferase family 4 protein [Candidatus Polarisedimenticolia bacterium]|nr:glycosyltransferase family 4 protein [Candidatus Polarisedimenticolia bacterium]
MTEPEAILWIGRMRFSPVIRIREVELARVIARSRRVVALDRSDAPWDDPSPYGRIRHRLALASGGWKTLPGDGVERFRMPVWMSNRSPGDRLAARLNERGVRRALAWFGCRRVFHSSPGFFLPPEKERGYRCHFDLVDNYLDHFPDTRYGRARRTFLLDQLARADSLSTISHHLCTRIEQELGRRPAYVPNGAAIEAIASWPGERVQRLRARPGFAGRRLLVYVGNHMASFDGMEMLLDGFLAARRRLPELALLIVGPGAARVTAPRGLGPGDGVHAIGPVPADEVWDYFHAADLGLLPFVVEPGTDACLPLKVLEFGAAGRPMLASPLAELRRLALPHVRYAPHEAGAWGAALADEATYIPPDPATLAEAMRPFSWERAAAALIEAMEGPSASRGR